MTLSILLFIVVMFLCVYLGIKLSKKDFESNLPRYTHKNIVRNPTMLYQNNWGTWAPYTQTPTTSAMLYTTGLPKYPDVELLSNLHSSLNNLEERAIFEIQNINSVSPSENTSQISHLPSSNLQESPPIMNEVAKPDEPSMKEDELPMKEEEKILQESRFSHVKIKDFEVGKLEL